MGRYQKVYWEYGTEAKAASVDVRCADLTAGNFTTQEGLRAAFEAAVDAVSLGNSGSENFIAVTTDVGFNPSPNPIAQRENRWLVSFRDNTTQRAGNFIIPCYDPALLAPDGSNMDPTSTEYAGLVTATEAFVRSVNGNPVTVTSIKFRARTI